VINNDVASEIGISTPLEESILLINPLLNLRQDPIFLWLNSLGDIITEDYTRILIGPHVESGVDDPLFHSDLFRNMVHTTGNFNPISLGPSRTLWRTSSRQYIFDKLGISHLHSRTYNKPMASLLGTPTTLRGGGVNECGDLFPKTSLLHKTH